MSSQTIYNETHSGPVLCPKCKSTKVLPVKTIPVVNVVIEYKCECGEVFRVHHRDLFGD